MPDCSVRSGGHSYTCNSIKAGSLHIDMRGINTVQIVQDSDSPTGLVAMLDAGATWGSVGSAFMSGVKKHPNYQLQLSSWPVQVCRSWWLPPRWCSQLAGDL